MRWPRADVTHIGVMVEVEPREGCVSESCYLPICLRPVPVGFTVVDACALGWATVDADDPRPGAKASCPECLGIATRAPASAHSARPR